MEDIDDSPCRNVCVDFHKKYKSGLFKNIPRSHSKRLKTDAGKLEECLPPIKEALNLGFVQETKESRCGSPFSAKRLSQHVKPQLKSKVGKSLKNKTNEPRSSISLEETIATADKDCAALKIRRQPKTPKENLNVAFVEECQSISSTKPSGNIRKQRRLSGLFKPALNTGFIEEHPFIGEGILSREEEGDFTYTNSHEDESVVIEEDLEIKGTGRRRSTCTPVKFKLRRRPQKKVTDEDIIKYYTDKSVKKKQNTLETIFETPRPEPMSVKKYKRFLNFNERMSSVKIRKRHGKIVKYNLWQNTKPLSMDYVVRKLEGVEDDL